MKHIKSLSLILIICFFVVALSSCSSNTGTPAIDLKIQGELMIEHPGDIFKVVSRDKRELKEKGSDKIIGVADVYKIHSKKYNNDFYYILETKEAYEQRNNENGFKGERIKYDNYCDLSYHKIISDEIKNALKKAGISRYELYFDTSEITHTVLYDYYTCYNRVKCGELIDSDANDFCKSTGITADVVIFEKVTDAAKLRDALKASLNNTITVNCSYVDLSFWFAKDRSVSLNDVFKSKINTGIGVYDGYTPTTEIDKEQIDFTKVEEKRIVIKNSYNEGAELLYLVIPDEEAQLN